jgi:hypothetical protein
LLSTAAKKSSKHSWSTIEAARHAGKKKNKVSKARAETKVQIETVAIPKNGTKTRELSDSFGDANKYN